MASTYPWPDLSKHDASLRLIVMNVNDSLRVKIILGGEKYPEKMADLGYSLSSRGFYFSPGATVENVSEMLSAFPGASIEQFEARDIAMTAKQAAPLLAYLTQDVDQVENEALDEDELLQVEYIPASKLPSGKVKVPRNLEAATQEALAKLKTFIGGDGDVDKFVADSLGITVEELGERLDADQVDTVAMAQFAFARDRGYIIGDTTGLGKGRSISALALAAIKKGQRVVFMTEKPTLLSDIYRDLSDVKALDDINFLPLNPMVSVVDKDDNLVAQTSHETVNGFRHKREIDDQYTFLATSYSQFRTVMGRTESDQPANRMELLIKYMKDHDTLLILDESDTASGVNSNTSENISHLKRYAKHVVNSSATSITKEDNFVFYDEILPPGIGGYSIGKTLKEGGDATQEALSEMLVREGVMMVRQHDYSGMVINMVEDVKRLAKNQELTDKLSEILSAMSLLSGEVKELVDNRNKELEEKLTKEEVDRTKEDSEVDYSRVKRRLNLMSTKYTHFGSRLYTLNRQFLLTINVDHAVERATKAIEDGYKPIIVLTRTINAQLKDKLEQAGMEVEMDEDDDLDSLFEDEGVNHVPSFKETLTRVLKSSLNIKTHVKGKVHEEVVDRLFASKVAAIEGLIENFPDIDVTPIDSMIEKLDKIGLRGGEITGRQLHIQTVDGVKTIQKREKVDRNQVKSDFNNGELDYLIVGIPGASGASLHNSQNVKDQRPRRMIFVETPDRANLLIQFLGRTWRKGLVGNVLPSYEVLSSGMPLEMYYNATLDKKLRQLSACTTSNRQSNTLSKAPDILNQFGNSIALAYLEDNSDVAKTLNIEPQQDTDMAIKRDYIRLLLGRINLLPVSRQRQVLSEINHIYDTRLKEMLNLGINPIGSSHNDWKASVESEELFRGGIEDVYQSVFDEPIVSKTVTYNRRIIPLRSFEMEREMETNAKALKKKDWIQGDESLSVIVAALEAGKWDYIKHVYEHNFGRSHSMHELIESQEWSPVKAAYEKTTFLIEKLKNIEIGSVFNMIKYGEDNKVISTKEGLVVNVNFFSVYDEQDMYKPTYYEVDIATPGEDSLYSLNLQSMFERESSRYNRIEYRFEGERYSKEVGELFDMYPEGEVEESRQLYEGNIFTATQIMGRKGNVITYSDKDNVTHRAVMLDPKYKYRNVIDKSRYPVRSIEDLINSMVYRVENKKEGNRTVFDKEKETSSTVKTSRHVQSAYITSFPNDTKFLKKGITIELERKENLYTIHLPDAKVSKRKDQQYTINNPLFDVVRDYIKTVELAEIKGEEGTTSMVGPLSDEAKAQKLEEEAARAHFEDKSLMKTLGKRTTFQSATDYREGLIYTRSPELVARVIEHLQHKGITFFVNPNDFNEYMAVKLNKREIQETYDELTSQDEPEKLGSTLRKGLAAAS